MNHHTGDITWFSILELFPEPRPYGRQFAHGMGTIHLEMYMYGQWRTFPVSPVIYVPGANNVFSEKYMSLTGHKIEKDDKIAVFRNGRLDGAWGLFDKNMWIMKFRRPVSGSQENAEAIPNNGRGEAGQANPNNGSEQAGQANPNNGSGEAGQAHPKNGCEKSGQANPKQRDPFTMVLRDRSKLKTTFAFSSTFV